MAQMALQDWLSVFAVLLSPLIAVQVTEYLQRRRAKADRQRDVFETLMATRANRLSRDHVNALNRIDVEFHGEKGIRQAWRAYLDSLSQPGFVTEVRAAERDRLFVEMLSVIAKALRYDFDLTDIRRTAYWPAGSAEYDADAVAIRKFIVNLSTGRASVPVYISAPPPQSEPPGDPAQNKPPQLPAAGGPSAK
jgi:hypothetical protein